MIEHIDIINALNDQLEALLDLIMSTNDECVDIKSIQVAAEMCTTLQMEIMQEITKIQEEWLKEHKDGTC